MLTKQWTAQIGYVKAGRMTLTVDGLILMDELRVCTACCPCFLDEGKKNLIIGLTLLSKC